MNPESRIDLKRLLKTLLIIAFALALVILGGGYLYVKAILKEDDLSLLRQIEPYLSSYAQEAETRETDDSYRIVVSCKDMNSNLVNAFVASEDRDFWQHDGVSSGKVLDLVADVLTFQTRLGSKSTITQQLVRNTLLLENRMERSIPRRIKEIYYTLNLEDRYSKEQILEAYLNQVYLGAGVSGVEAASQTYFSKSASELTIMEAAILAGIPKSPISYAPVITKLKKDITLEDVILDDSDPKYTIIYNPNCEVRYHVVIELMNQSGYLSDSDYSTARDFDIQSLIHFRKPPSQ